MIIDEKGRLFGLINLLDLVLLIGVVILLYLGATVYLIYRQPVLTMKDITPKQIEVGQSQLFTLTLANERRLAAARIRLIPKDFQGGMVQLGGQTDKRRRNMVIFTVPPEVQPGQYQIELEVVTVDIFNRQALYTTRSDKQVLTIKPKLTVVEERGKYFWPMELEVFFPPEQKAAIAGLRPRAEVAGLSGGFIATVLSVRGSRSSDTLSLTGKPWWDTAIPYRGGRVARMRAEVDFVDLPSFQQKVLSSGGRLDLRHGKQDLTGYLLGMVAVEPQLPDNLVRWEVYVVMLSLNDAQRQALRVNAMQVDPNSGMVLAQVVQVLGGKGSPLWKVVPATEPGVIAPKASPSNIVVQMNILCELKDGRAYFRGVPVKQEALLSFELNGQRMVGTVLTVEEDIPPPKKIFLKEERGKYFWPMELEVFFPPEQKAATAGLRPGAEVAGLSGGFIATVLSVRGSRSTDTLNLTGKPWWKTAIPYRGGRVARMRAEVDFVDLPSFQQKVLSSGDRLVLRHGEQYLTGYLLGMVAVEPQLPDNFVRWEVYVVMLSLNDAQRQALKANAMQVDPNSGLVLAQVAQVLGGKGSPWRKVVPATEPGKIAPKSSPSNIMVRMKILCELKDGRAYFRGVPVKQEALLSFELDGQRMVGTVLTAEEPVAIQFNVLFPAVPRQVTAQIKKGMLVYDPKTMEHLGTIQKVLASKPVELPYSFKEGYRELGREYRRCLVRMEIYCSSDKDGLISYGQRIDYGLPLRVLLMSEPLEGIITIHETLPPKGKFNWQEAIAVRHNVFFPMVPRQVAENIHNGMLIHDPGTRETMGIIQEILEAEPVKPPYSFKADDRVDLSREYKRCLLRMEIYCSSDKSGQIYSYGQKIDYGSPLKVLLFSEQVEGIVTILDSLTPQIKLSWQEVKVVFKNLSPTMAALIREGETEAVENEPVTMVLERIISDEPTQYLGITEAGTIKVSRHPLNRDIRCRLRIMAYRNGEKLFYKGNQLYLGGEITFKSARWMANGELIDF